MTDLIYALVLVALAAWLIFVVKRGSAVIGPCPNCANMAKVSVLETKELIELRVEVKRLKELCRVHGIDDGYGFGRRLGEGIETEPVVGQ